MKVLLLLLALAHAAPDDGSEPGTDSPPPGEPAAGAPPDPTPVVFATALDSAKRLYFEGEHEAALAMLEGLRARIDGGEVVLRDQYVETLVYLGELQFQLGDKTASWSTYETLVVAIPDAEMSLMEHPIDVVRWFELVRDSVEQDRVPVPIPEPIGPPPPLPVWGYAPFGVPQFAMGRTGRGVAFATLQTGFAAVSIWSYVRLAGINGENHPPQWPDDEVAQRVNVERWAIQWPATLGFYATWVISVFDARRAWRLDHAPPVAVGVEPRPAGAVLVVRGRL